jgi:hypothetical protein
MSWPPLYWALVRCQQIVVPVPIGVRSQIRHPADGSDGSDDSDIRPLARVWVEHKKLVHSKRRCF